MRMVFGGALAALLLTAAQVVEGDKRPARSVRNLTGIELRDLK